MSNSCPICYESLEIREVAPCYNCGGWPGVKPSKPEHEFEFEDGSKVMICNICWLEEICSNQGDLKKRLN